MRVFAPSLLYLIRLQWKGRIRRLGSKLRTWKGFISLLIILGLVGLWGYGIYLSVSSNRGAMTIGRDSFATAMMFILLMNLIFARWDVGLGFRAEEIAFLFPGPFSRRELLLYRMTRDAFGMFLASIPAALFVGSFAGTWFGALIGVFLAMCCLSFSQTLFSIIGATVAESMIARGRIAVVILFTAAIGLSYAFSGTNLNPEDWGGLLQSPFLKVFRAPFVPFARVVSATEYFPDLAGWLAASVGILSVLVAGILGLESNFNEAAISASQRMLQRLEQIRKGRVGWTPTIKGGVKFGLPQLPRLAGAGPIIWHHLTGLVRSLKGTALFIVLVILGFAWPHFTFMRSEHGSQLISSLMPMTIFFTVMMLPQFLRFDFRGEIDRMPMLKTLPIRPLPLVLGELAVPTFALTFFQMLIAAVFAAAGAVTADQLLIGVAFSLPANALIFGVENLMFLLYPTPLPTGGGGVDMEAMPKHMLMSILKLLVLGATGGLCAGIGAVVGIFLDSPMLGFAAAWLTAILIVLGLVQGIVVAFDKFNPAEDMPG